MYLSFSLLTILLISRTSVLNYQQLSNEQKSQLSGIKFVSFWHSQLKNPDSEGVSKSCENVIYLTQQEMTHVSFPVACRLTLQLTKTATTNNISNDLLIFD